MIHWPKLETKQYEVSTHASDAGSEWVPYHRGHWWDDWHQRSDTTYPRPSKWSIVGMLRSVACFSRLLVWLVGWFLLLTSPLWLLSIYYFSCFQIRHLEDPKYDLMIVHKDDPGELAFFRKKTGPDFIEPAERQLAALIKMRKESLKGTATPDDYKQRVGELHHRLDEIRCGAKLRQIPKVYEKKYLEVLIAIFEAHRSLLAFETAMETANPEEKTKLINESIKWSKSAKKRFKAQRNFFFVK